MSDEKPVYDRSDQFKQVASGLLEGERLYAVYDAKGAGTGFIGLTDRRVVLQDKSFVGKRVALVSVPYGRIASVAVISNASVMGSFFSSSAIVLTTSAGGNYEVEFRGNDRARHAHDLILYHLTEAEPE
jgi:hypothetical protein